MKKIKTPQSLCILISGFLLIGCNEVTGDVSESNFTKAIEKYYNGICIIPTPTPQGSSNPYPATIKKSEAGLFLNGHEVSAIFNENIKPYDAFETVGLLNKESIQNETNEIVGYRYSLSSEGKKYLVGQTSRNFCAGNYKIEKITSIEPPIQSETVDEPFDEVEVTFSYQAINVAPWAETSTILDAFPLLKEKLSGQKENTKTLRLRNNVWSVIY